MSKIETALGLMYSMICGGESHSATSISAYDEAKKELAELRADNEALRTQLAAFQKVNKRFPETGGR